MNDSTNETNIRNMIQPILENKKKQGNLEIWGGEIEKNKLKGFLEAWNFEEMSYSIIETINTMVFEKDFNFQNWQDTEFDSFQRARIFGIKGDLEIRKDGASFFWRFIGDDKPPENYQQNDFWKNHPNQEFFTAEEEAFLWGKYNALSERWRSDKVGKANLNYPLQERIESSRVKLNFETYSHNAQIAFVRLKGIKEVQTK